ncbi:MAG: cell division protein FtsA [Alphaproteobacteria bacterium]|jgi:cell division protein FtsA|nr:cell division protein FtsA [Alphaproteobacteria bacterium]
MGFYGRKRARSKGNGDLLAVLDVGTTKVACFIGRVAEGGRVRIIGLSHQVNRGVKAGSIVDMEAAEAAIGSAVTAAEDMAGETIHGLLVSMAGGHPSSRTVGIEVDIAGHAVSDADIRQALKIDPDDLPDDSELVHAIPVTYALDGNRGIRDPRGMFGDTLGLELHLVSTASGAMRNLATCIQRCHLQVDAFVTAPYASGLACLVEDEMQLGATVIDLGGGTTSVGVFFDGRLVFVDSLPVGGAHVTNDIARGLTTSITAAERLKTFYGSAVTSPADDRELIDVPLIGERDPDQSNHVPKSLLTGIIQPRLEEVFELVRSRLEASGFHRVAGRRVVLTGGASQMQGIQELARTVLDKQVRLGRPRTMPGLAEATSGPAFSAAVGLLAHADRHYADMAVVSRLEDGPAGGLLGRLGGWIREYL